MHIEKFKSFEIGGVLAHIERRLTKEGRPRQYSNENIDVEKSHLNYRIDGTKSPFHKYKKILNRDNVKMQNRKDVNSFCSVALTLPEDVKPEDERKFFQKSYEFLCKRYAPYGNCVMCEIHKDEIKGKVPGRAHMHFVFVPLVVDKKYKEKTNQIRYKVSAKELINLEDLKNLHKDCSEFIENVLGYRVSILIDEDKKITDPLKKLEVMLKKGMLKNLSSSQYKEIKDYIKNIVKSITDMKKELDNVQEQHDNLFDDFMKLTERYNLLDDDIKKMTTKKKELDDYINECHFIAENVLGDEAFEH